VLPEVIKNIDKGITQFIEFDIQLTQQKSIQEKEKARKLPIVSEIKKKEMYV